MSDRVQVDHSVLRTNQMFIIALLIAAFITDTAWLALFVAVVMLIGTFVARKAGFAPLYFRVLKPLGWIKPEVIPDNPQPHLFAQGLGGFFVLGGALALYLSQPIVGWALAWLVIFLAALNLFAGFCVGCMIYYWLNRLRVPGFSAAPVPGAFPGMKPPRNPAQSRT